MSHEYGWLQHARRAEISSRFVTKKLASREYCFECETKKVKKVSPRSSHSQTNVLCFKDHSSDMKFLLRSTSHIQHRRGQGLFYFPYNKGLTRQGSHSNLEYLIITPTHSPMITEYTRG